MTLPPVSQALTDMGIPHRVFRHPGPVKSLEQAAAERGQLPEQIVRSIVFRLSADEFVMALMAGPQQIDWKALRRYLGEKRLTMASEEEVLREPLIALDSVERGGFFRVLWDSLVLFFLQLFGKG